jgi:hypothetical protein
MKRKRFVVTAVWSGYHSGQTRVCHRTVETLFRAGYEALRWHQFSDGTGLHINVRDALPRERIHTINGYGSILRDAAMDKWNELRNQERASA